MTLVDESVWGAHVDTISHLERELARLRRASTAHAKEQGHSVARAAVLNLVVYADRELHARRAATSSARLADRHPSRAIIVLGDREREAVDVSIELPSGSNLEGEASIADLHCEGRLGECRDICAREGRR